MADPNYGSQDIENLSKAVQSIILGKNFEYRFSKPNKNLKRDFFINFSNFNFKFYCIYIDKSKIISKKMFSKKFKFYNYFISKFINKLPFNHAKIVIDGSNEKDFKKAFKVSIRNATNKKILKVKFANSKKEPLIQLADMCIGAYVSSIKDKQQTYYKYIKNNSIIWKF